MRATYLGLYCVTPFVHHSFLTALFHVWLMSCVESLTLAIPFALSHNFQDAERHPVKNGKVCWYKSQVMIAPSRFQPKLQFLLDKINLCARLPLTPSPLSAHKKNHEPKLECCAGGDPKS